MTIIKEDEFEIEDALDKDNEVKLSVFEVQRDPMLCWLNEEQAKHLIERLTKVFDIND